MHETPTSLVLTLLRHNGEEVEITWSEVQCISAFKQDLFNPQIVVLEFCCTDANWEIDAQDCQGFAFFSQILARHLPEVTPFEVWWPAVTNPLGRQDVVTLYNRSPHQSPLS
jgi:hypothetical protein